jgi:serine phosphatase RsbU (regulator of sigma subunit)
MSEKEKEQILKVLSGAIQRETGAFNFYSRKSEDPTMPSGVKGLLARLAEEERKHRRLLVTEYMSVKKGWVEREDAKKGKILSYDLPEKLDFIPLETAGDLEIAAVSLPSRLVGGDNILSFVLSGQSGKETQTVLVLYDVMGHSLETTVVNALAARIVGEHGEMSGTGSFDKGQMSPKSIVGLLNKGLYEEYGGEGTFLTMLCVLFDREEEVLTFTCAGHEPPFVVMDDGKVASMLNTQLIVGIDPDYPYREHEVPFGKDNLFCVFSDGIIEVKNEKGEYFGREGVKKVLERCKDKPPRDIVVDMLEEVGAFIGDRHIEDEVSIIIVKSKGE